MPKLVTAILCRNEADKYLERVLTRCLEFSSKVLVLDDGSTDGSDRIAWRLGCEVRQRTGESMWGNESPARAELYDWGAREAGDGWLLVADADMLLHGDPRPLTLSTQVNAWAWPLFDLWNDERWYRCDGFWQGHAHSRVWMVRPNALKEPPKWPQRGLHSGHFPVNYPYAVADTGPLAPNEGGLPPLYWNHLAYVSPDHRRIKMEQYLGKLDHLSPWEAAHARSVGD